eukprot:gene19990-biopygen6439
MVPTARCFLAGLRNRSWRRTIPWTCQEAPSEWGLLCSHSSTVWHFDTSPIILEQDERLFMLCNEILKALLLLVYVYLMIAQD